MSTGAIVSNHSFLFFSFFFFLPHLHLLIAILCINEYVRFFFKIWYLMTCCEYVQLFILLSCSLAVFCNMSQYLCIGRFSAVSFQVLGHMKTVCVLTLGWLLFDSALTFKNIMGMFLAVLGMVIYSWAVESEKRSNNKTLSHTKNSLTEEEIRLLKEGVETGPVKDVELGESKA